MGTELDKDNSMEAEDMAERGTEEGDLNKQGIRCVFSRNFVPGNQEICLFLETSCCLLLSICLFTDHNIHNFVEFAPIAKDSRKYEGRKKNIDRWRIRIKRLSVDSFPYTEDEHREQKQF